MNSGIQCKCICSIVLCCHWAFGISFAAIDVAVSVHGGSIHLIHMCVLAKVFQVKKKDTGKIYAMKVMRKERILEKDHAKYVLSEKNALTAIDHPYIVRIFSSFQVE